MIKELCQSESYHFQTQTKIKRDKVPFTVGTTVSLFLCPGSFSVQVHANIGTTYKPLYKVGQFWLCPAQIVSFSFQMLIHISPPCLNCSGRSESFSSVLNSSINVAFVIHEVRMLFGVFFFFLCMLSERTKQKSCVDAYNVNIYL